MVVMLESLSSFSGHDVRGKRLFLNLLYVLGLQLLIKKLLSIVGDHVFIECTYTFLRRIHDDVFINVLMLDCDAFVMTRLWL